MAGKKKEVYKPKPMTENKRSIIRGLFEEYDIQTADDIQEALKDLLSGTLKEMMEAEMDIVGRIHQKSSQDICVLQILIFTPHSCGFSCCSLKCIYLHREYTSVTSFISVLIVIVLVLLSQQISSSGIL